MIALREGATIIEHEHFLSCVEVSALPRTKAHVNSQRHSRGASEEEK